MVSVFNYLHAYCTFIHYHSIILVMQYFYDWYCREIRVHLTSFDKEFKDIDKQLMEVCYSNVATSLY